MSRTRRVLEIEQTGATKCPRVLHVATASLSLKLMQGQLAFLREAGYEVAVMTSPGGELRAAGRSAGIETYAVPMAREISPLRDLKSLVRLYRVVRCLRPSITNVGTPKAGLLAGIAAWLARVPCRFYTLRGLRCETARGLKRRILLLSERIACLCAHKVICVSESLRQRAVALGIVPAHHALVLGSGSSNGVDSSRFLLTPELRIREAGLRQELKIPQEAQVVGFVGRLTRDKGIAELVKAFSRLCETSAAVWLLLVGDFEDTDPLPADVRRAIETHPKIIRTGFVAEATSYYHLMDVLALPTYREGFPNAILEAHAAGKPVVATRATGVVDAVLDGVTGVLVPVGDAETLAKGLESLLRNRDTATRMGSAGRERVRREFQQERIWGALAREYSHLLSARGLPQPKKESQRVSSAVPADQSAIQS
jgi:glycosyltransferase involved in cell wall biosynthesis